LSGLFIKGSIIYFSSNNGLIEELDLFENKGSNSSELYVSKGIGGNFLGVKVNSPLNNIILSPTGILPLDSHFLKI